LVAGVLAGGVYRLYSCLEAARARKAASNFPTAWRNKLESPKALLMISSYYESYENIHYVRTKPRAGSQTSQQIRESGFNIYLKMKQLLVLELEGLIPPLNFVPMPRLAEQNSLHAMRAARLLGKRFFCS
jgi:hypothetical protein